MCVAQVVNKKLNDTRGGYAQFLRENAGEAKVMEEKEKRVKVLEQSTVKAKSKVSCPTLTERQTTICQLDYDTILSRMQLGAEVEQLLKRGVTCLTHW